MAADHTLTEAVAALQKILLSWNYADLAEKMEKGSGLGDHLKPVPTAYSSVKEYIATFEPLMLEECAALLMRGSQEGEDQPSHAASVSSTATAGEFTQACMTVREGIAASYSRNDMVLLSKDDPGNWEALRPELSALGCFEGRAGEQSMNLRLYLAADSQASQPAEAQRIENVRQALSKPLGKWYLLRLSNMSTIMREWEALHKLPLLPFCTPFLSGRFGPADAKQRMYVPPALYQALKGEYNSSQMTAMQSGLAGDPIVLIQGPPGTGKTRTIMGLLSTVLHSSPHRIEASHHHIAKQAGSEAIKGEDLMRLWLKACPWAAGNPPARDAVKPWQTGSHEDCFGLTAISQPVRISKVQGNQSRVLVCAPSNSALDEMLRRVLQFGIRNRQGNICRPACVRVGLNPHHEVKHIALDVLVAQRLASSTQKGGKHANSGERDIIRAAVLEEAQIVFSTLSFSGSTIFSASASKFDCVIIDEAAQAIEPSTLIPLVSGCQQVYLVGDPTQLPATVISARAEAAGYSTSLFKRIQTAQGRVQLLDTQYRMHPAISSFPSAQFYRGQLCDAEGMAAATVRPWHEHPCFGPVAFFDVEGQEAQSSNYSISNESEALMVLLLYDALTRTYPQLRADPAAHIGVISPYKAQVNLIKSKMVEALGEKANEIDIHSIDGFQGREKDIIIFSTVRTRQGARIGFVADERRINVGLTRAKTSLLLVGHAPALSRDSRWSMFVDMATEARYMYKPTEPYSAWIDDAMAGKVSPVQPAPDDVDDFMPQAEPGVLDGDDGDTDMLSDDTGQAAPAKPSRRANASKKQGQKAPKTRKKQPGK